MPTTFEMTENLVARVRDSTPPGGAAASALHFVCASLMAHDAATTGQSPFSGLDVERVFSAVELLAERNELEVTPFVASWHPAVNAWDTQSKGAPAFFNRDLQKALLESPSFGGAGKLITALIDARTGSAADGTTYRRLAEEMLVQLRELVATTPKAVGYLTPLAQAARQDGLTIATLNYDLTVEQAAQTADVPCATGVETWLGTGRWEWPRDGHTPSQAPRLDRLDLGRDPGGARPFTSASNFFGARIGERSPTTTRARLWAAWQAAGRGAIPQPAGRA